MVKRKFQSDGNRTTKHGCTGPKLGFYDTVAMGERLGAHRKRPFPFSVGDLGTSPGAKTRHPQTVWGMIVEEGRRIP